MNFFKLYLKVMKRSILFPLITALLFIVLLAVSVYVPTENSVVKNYRSIVSLVDHDQTEFTSILKSDILQYADVTDEVMDRDDLQDAFVRGRVKYYVEIPKGFTESFLNNTMLPLQEGTLSNSRDSIYIRENINSFLNNASIYAANTKGDADMFYTLLENTQQSAKLNVTHLIDRAEQEEILLLSDTFSELAYVLLFAVSQIVAIFFIILNRDDIRKRCFFPPVRQSRYMMEVVLANIVFVLGLLAVVVSSIAIMTKATLDTRFLLYTVNAGFLSLVAIGIGMLTGTVAKSSVQRNAMLVSVTMALSFIGGVFMPLRLMPQAVQTVSSFLPTFWFIQGNMVIERSGSLDTQRLLLSFFIQLVFAVGLFGLTSILSKRAQRMA